MNFLLREREFFVEVANHYALSDRKRARTRVIRIYYFAILRYVWARRRAIRSRRTMDTDYTLFILLAPMLRVIYGSIKTESRYEASG